MFKIIKSTFHLTKSIIVGLILACIITFMVNNREKITIHLFPLPFTIETRLFILMIACFLLGLVCGILLLSRNIINNAVSNWKKHRKIKSEKSVDLQS
ncbi:MAG: LapA family protein [Rickettsiales bacterium]|nr:LapA family protein [Rickettsiales bacterium]